MVDLGFGPVSARRHVNSNGSQGGWVADTAKVDPSVYVGSNVKVIDTAKVSGNVQLHDNVEISGNARVSGDATLKDNVKVGGKSAVYGTAELSGDVVVEGESGVSGRAKVHGKARIINSSVYEDAEVGDNALVTGGSIVFMNAKVYGDAKVSAQSQISGNARVYDNGKVIGAQVNGDAEVFKNGVTSYPATGTVKIVGKVTWESNSSDAGYVHLDDLYSRMLRGEPTGKIPQQFLEPKKDWKGRFKEPQPNPHPWYVA